MKTEIIAPLGLSGRRRGRRARRLPPALSVFINGRSDVSGNMALRIEKAFGVKMGTLMRMQTSLDIARARRRAGDVRVGPYRPSAAGA